jgi:cellulose synthase/poly-beta-1,6-N-acetylglucosamine synthase-like glycosyltransferase
VTDVPTTWKALSGQRRRWDRGELRTYFQKHRQVMRPSVSSWSFAFGVWTEFLFFFVMTLTYPIYLVWLVTRGWHLFAFVMVVSFVAYALLSMIPALCIRIVSTRVRRQWPLIEAALVTPIYKGMLRWVRVKAIVLELLRIGYQDGYLPEKAWVHAPRTWPLPPGKVLEE